MAVLGGRVATPDTRWTAIWFTTFDELARRPDLESVPIVLVGRTRSLAPSSRVLDIDSTPWTGHSSEQSLIAGCNALAAIGSRVLLFHNFSKRIKKFVRDTGVDAVPLSGTMTL
ncbi:MAG: hypothetical protein R2699_03615 [Acidimicrobiales bacterium]